MLIANFHNSTDLHDYHSSFLKDNCIPNSPLISNILVNKNSAAILVEYIENDNKFSHDNFHQYVIDHHNDVFLASSDNSIINDFNHNYRYIFIGNKTSLSKELFSEVHPNIATNYLSVLMDMSFQGKDFIALTHASKLSFRYNEINIPHIDYSSYLSDIKSVIASLQAENKFYHKHLSSLQKEVVQLRKENSDLQEQLQIKSITSWS